MRSRRLIGKSPIVQLDVIKEELESEDESADVRVTIFSLESASDYEIPQEVIITEPSDSSISGDEKFHTAASSMVDAIIPIGEYFINFSDRLS